MEKDKSIQLKKLFKDFLYMEMYDVRKVKILFRGWIKTALPEREESIWEKKVIKEVLEFYHHAWSRRNKIKYGADTEARRRIQKDLLLEKIYEAYDRRDD